MANDFFAVSHAKAATAPSICSVVVTFNRKKLLGECINALLAQTLHLQRVYVIDNASSDGTKTFLQEAGLLSDPRITYRLLPQNVGGSGGFYEGVRQAYQDGYDWIWVMDDDAEPHPTAAEAFLPYVNDPQIMALANRKVSIEGHNLTSHWGQKPKWYNIWSNADIKSRGSNSSSSHPEDIYYSSFVGLAIRRDVIQQVGLPRKELFIGVDDLEYCARLSTIGRILLLPESIIIHKEVPLQQTVRHFFGRTIERIPIGRYWRFYFFLRNECVVAREYRGLIIALVVMLYLFSRTAVGILLFDDYKKERMRIIMRGCIDFLCGRFDNEWALSFRELPHTTRK